MVCSSESLIAFQLSLWLCMPPPQWDMGTENPCNAWYLPPSSNKLQQERTEEKSLHQADECGTKRHRFVTAQPLRGGDVCELARAAEKENTFLSQQPFYTIALVFVYMIAATGGNPHCCCWGCRAQGGSRGLICSWNKVTWPAFVKTPPGSEGQEGQHNPSTATLNALAVASQNAAGSYVGCEGLRETGNLGWGSAGSNSHTGASPASAERMGSDAGALHHQMLLTLLWSQLSWHQGAPQTGSAEVAGLIRRVWDLLLYPRYRTSALG